MTRYLVFEYKYSPDFGLEEPKVNKLFSTVEKAEGYRKELLVQKWKDIFKVDRSGWDFGGHYVYYKEKLIEAGFQEKGMTEDQIRNMVEKINANTELVNFDFAKIKKVEER